MLAPLAFEQNLVFSNTASSIRWGSLNNNALAFNSQLNQLEINNSGTAGNYGTTYIHGPSLSASSLQLRVTAGSALTMFPSTVISNSMSTGTIYINGHINPLLSLSSIALSASGTTLINSSAAALCVNNTQMIVVQPNTITLSPTGSTSASGIFSLTSTNALLGLPLQVCTNLAVSNTAVSIASTLSVSDSVVVQNSLDVSGQSVFRSTAGSGVSFLGGFTSALPSTVSAKLTVSGVLQLGSEWTLTRNSVSKHLTLETSTPSTFVGIFNNAPTAPLHISQATLLDVGTNASSSTAGGTLTVIGGIAVSKDARVGGTVTATSFSSYSDDTLKTHVSASLFKETHYWILWKLMQLTPVCYRLESSSSTTPLIGFSAQDVKRMFPFIVETDPKGVLAIDYSKMSVLVIYALRHIVYLYIALCLVYLVTFLLVI